MSIWAHGESPVKVQAVAATQRLRVPVPTEQAWPGNWQVFPKSEAVASPGEGKRIFLVQLSYSRSQAQLLFENIIYLFITSSSLPCCTGFSPAVAAVSSLPGSLLSWGSRCRSCRLQKRSTQAQECWLTGLFALQLVGPSWIGDETHVFSPGRLILYR